MKIPIPKLFIERKNGVFKVTISTELKSDCCPGSAVLIPDKNGDGFCGGCKDHTRGWSPTKIQLIKQ